MYVTTVLHILQPMEPVALYKFLQVWQILQGKEQFSMFLVVVIVSNIVHLFIHLKKKKSAIQMQHNNCSLTKNGHKENVEFATCH